MARLMAKVVAEDCRKETVTGLALGDREMPCDVGFPVRLAYNSKVLFSLMAVKAAVSRSRFIFDGCHLGQVHALPCLRGKPMLTFLHGIEVWEDAPARYVRSARAPSCWWQIPPSRVTRPTGCTAGWRIARGMLARD